MKLQNADTDRAHNHGVKAVEPGWTRLTSRIALPPTLTKQDYQCSPDVVPAFIL